MPVKIDEKHVIMLGRVIDARFNISRAVTQLKQELNVLKAELNQSARSGQAAVNADLWDRIVQTKSIAGQLNSALVGLQIEHDASEV